MRPKVQRRISFTRYSSKFGMFCVAAAVVFLSLTESSCALNLFQPPEQTPDMLNVGDCPRLADPTKGDRCAQASPLLSGAIYSGLLNEITDYDMLRSDQLPGIHEQVSSTITEFLVRLPKTGYDTRVRPDVYQKPVVVSCSVYIGDISKVSEFNMDFTADLYFRQSWDDHRLMWNATELGIHESISLSGDFINFLWRPDTYIPNAKVALPHEVTRSNAFLRITPHGHVKQSIRLTVTAQCYMDFRLFPMDNQQCSIQIESYSLPVTDLIYLWRHMAYFEGSSNLPPISIGTDASSLPQLTIRGFRSLETFIERMEGRNHSRLVIEIFFSRSLGYYLIQVYLPASLVVVISWVSFWIPRQSQPARVILGVTTVLTLTLMTGQGNSSLPKISYLKALDLFMIFCYFMVFLALIEYAFVSYAVKSVGEQENRDANWGTNDEGELVQLPPTLLAESLFAAVPLFGMQSPSSPLLPRKIDPNESASGALTSPRRLWQTNDTDSSTSSGRWRGVKLAKWLPSRIELSSRFGFPLTFVIFNVCYWNYFLQQSKLATTETIPGFIEYDPHH